MVVVVVVPVPSPSACINKVCLHSSLSKFRLASFLAEPLGVVVVVVVVVLVVVVVVVEEISYGIGFQCSGSNVVYLCLLSNFKKTSIYPSIFSHSLGNFARARFVLFVSGLYRGINIIVVVDVFFFQCLVHGFSRVHYILGSMGFPELSIYWVQWVFPS